LVVSFISYRFVPNLKTSSMKKLILLFAILLLVSCENESDVKTDLENLKIERTKLEAINNVERDHIKATKRELEALKNVVRATSIAYHEVRIEKGMADIGKEPMYVLTLKMKQSRTSLSIGKHIKDNMNAITFDLPVSKEFYKNVKVGTPLVDDFRSGSFIMNGSFSNWKITVIEKNIR